MKKLIKIVFLALLMFVINSSYAADSNYSNAVQTKVVHGKYIVSVILKQNGSEGVIRLVHAWQDAATESEALGLVVKAVQDKYDGYTIVSTLTTLTPTPSHIATCDFL